MNKIEIHSAYNTLDQEMLQCPFCDNENFTMTGLKYHLENECNTYREVGTKCTEPDCCFFGQMKSHACACRRKP